MLQKVAKKSEDEVKKELQTMKNAKADGLDNIPVEVLKCLGDVAVVLTGLFKRILESERTVEEWRRSVMVPIFIRMKQSCGSYRGINLMTHRLKIWETVWFYAKDKNHRCNICFKRMLLEKYRECQTELNPVRGQRKMARLVPAN